MEIENYASSWIFLIVVVGIVLMVGVQLISQLYSVLVNIAPNTPFTSANIYSNIATSFDIATIIPITLAGFGIIAIFMYSLRR